MTSGASATNSAAHLPYRVIRRRTDQHADAGHPFALLRPRCQRPRRRRAAGLGFGGIYVSADVGGSALSRLDAVLISSPWQH